MEQQNSRPALKHGNLLALFLIITVCSLCSAAFWPFWSGDAIIHLVYAEQAAAGKWFEFNPGEKSVGTTSIGWTYLMAFLFRFFGMKTGLIFQKIILWVAVVTIPITVFLFLRRLLPNSLYLSLFCSLLVAANPSFAYNAPLGMENPVFAAVALLALFSKFAAIRAIETRWIDAVISGLILGVATLLRPEGIILIAAALLTAIISLVKIREALTKKVILLAVITLAAFIPIVLGFGFLYRETGILFGGASAKARVMQARILSREIIPDTLFIDLKVPFRCIANFPMTAGLLLFPWLLLQYKRKNPKNTSTDSTNELQTVGGFIFTLASLALYAFITGAAHFGRYSIPILPCFAIIFGYAIHLFSRQFALSTKYFIVILLLSSLWYIPAYTVEWYLRRSDPRQQPATTIEALLKASRKESRKLATDAFLRMHNLTDVPVDKVTGIGCIEVQCRFDYDERIRVVSLDGRTWPTDTPMLFLPDGSIDFVSVITTLRPDIIVEKPQFVKTGKPDLITQWFELSPGKSISPHPEITLTRSSYGLKLAYK